jgi:glycosyltransferase involved in cell wall biosynthesis
MESDGKISMPGYLGLFVDSIASYCESVVCFQHSPTKHELSIMDYALKSDNVHLVSMGPHISIPSRIAMAYVKRRLLRVRQHELDVLLVRAPTPLLPILAPSWDKKLVLLIVADAVAGIENLPQPRWRKRLIRVYANWNKRRQLEIAKTSLTFVNSSLLYDEYQGHIPNLMQTRTTTLSEVDFYKRSDTCITPPYRLLFTGRMTRTKGLFEIVECLSNLTKSGFDVVLDLVGMVEQGDATLTDLFQFAHSLGVGDRVQYHGYKTAGPELLSYYRQADIYITASQASSEGFPRTIWEAMASSMPVVATSVGSIPSFVGGAAVLVPPKQVDSLTDAVRGLLTNPELRRRLIRRGMELAKNNTLERRAKELVERVENWVAL